MVELVEILIIPKIFSQCFFSFLGKAFLCLKGSLIYDLLRKTGLMSSAKSITLQTYSVLGFQEAELSQGCFRFLFSDVGLIYDYS